MKGWNEENEWNKENELTVNWIEWISEEMSKLKNFVMYSLMICIDINEWIGRVNWVEQNESNGQIGLKELIDVIRRENSFA